METPFTEIVLEEEDYEKPYVLHTILGLELVTEGIDGPVVSIRIPGDLDEMEQRFFRG